MTTVAATGKDGTPTPPPAHGAPPPSAIQAPAPALAAVSDPAATVAAPAQPGASFEAAGALSKVLKAVGSIVAPSTLLTALMFYFGLMYAAGYFQYLGVSLLVLDLPTQQYLILSADSSVVPLTYAACAALVALWLYQLPVHSWSARVRRTLHRVVLPLAAVLGLGLVVLALADATFGLSMFAAVVVGRGLSLSTGVLLLAYTARMRRMLTTRPAPAPRRVPEALVAAKWGGAFILVSVGLFWAVGSYAVKAGWTEARAYVHDIATVPNVALYSEKSLGLQGPGVREVACRAPDSAYKFRYEGLKLVPQSGPQYVFLPAGWTETNGAAMLLPRSDTQRLEFSSRRRSVAC